MKRSRRKKCMNPETVSLGNFTTVRPHLGLYGNFTYRECIGFEVNSPFREFCCMVSLITTTHLIKGFNLTLR